MPSFARINPLFHFGIAPAEAPSTFIIANPIGVPNASYALFVQVPCIRTACTKVSASIYSALMKCEQERRFVPSPILNDLSSRENSEAVLNVPCAMSRAFLFHFPSHPHHPLLSTCDHLPLSFITTQLVKLGLVNHFDPGYVEY